MGSHMIWAEKINIIGKTGKSYTGDGSASFEKLSSCLILPLVKISLSKTSWAAFVKDYTPLSCLAVCLTES